MISNENSNISNSTYCWLFFKKHRLAMSEFFCSHMKTNLSVCVFISVAHPCLPVLLVVVVVVCPCIDYNALCTVFVKRSGQPHHFINKQHAPPPFAASIVMRRSSLWLLSTFLSLKKNFGLRTCWNRFTSNNCSLGNASLVDSCLDGWWTNYIGNDEVICTGLDEEGNRCPLRTDAEIF